MNDINKTIKHFQSLQKRYTTQHNGQMCERVADALEALERFKCEIHLQCQEDFLKDMFMKCTIRPVKADEILSFKEV